MNAIPSNSPKPASWTEPRRETVVACDVDVLVAGGGPAGVAAAISAARTGARTCLVETAGCFGGMWTIGMQTHATCFHDGKRVIVGGIAREIVNRLGALGAAEDPDQKVRARPVQFWLAFDPEMMKIVLDDMLHEAGVLPLLHTHCVGAMVDKGRVTGVITESKSGRQAIRAGVTVDCTGDADIAFHAGAPTAKGRGSDGKCQPATLTFILAGVDYDRARLWAESSPGERELREQEARRRGELTTPQRISLGAPSMAPGVTYHNVTRILDVDATNAADLTRAEMEGRRQVMELVRYYRRFIPGFERCRLAGLAPSIGLRESRRIVGEYTLTASDVISARSFSDGIARHNYYIDVHSPDGFGLEGDAGPDQRPPPGSAHEVPYRCLLPLERDQLLVAGRCISADRQALGSVRTTVCCVELGQAAGVAAAWSVRDGTTVRAIDGAALKEQLTRLGAWVIAAT